MNVPITSRPDTNHTTLRDHTNSDRLHSPANQNGAHRPMFYFEVSALLVDLPPSFSNSDSLTCHQLLYNKVACAWPRNCIHVNKFLREHTARVSHLCSKVVSPFKYFDWLWGYRRQHVPIFNSNPPLKKIKSLKKSFSSVLHQEQRKHLLLPRGLRGPV